MTGRGEQAPIADRLTMWAGCLASFAMAAVWLGAALAGLVSGGRAPHPAGAPNALVRLPATLSQPAAAWPASDLPGPWLYWPAQLVVVLLAGALAVLAIRFLRPVERDGLGVNRSARFADRRDLRPLLVRQPEPGRIVLGRVGGRLVATQLGNSACVIGASGSGKTSGLLIPAILDMGKGHGSLIAMSVKGDLLHRTIAHRQKIGDVKVFDPALIVTDETNTWTPLRRAHTVTGAQSAARGLVDVAGTKSMEDGKWWSNAAFMLLWPLFLVAANSGKTMRDVVRWITTHDHMETDPDSGRVVVEGEVWVLCRELLDVSRLLGDNAGDIHPEPEQLERSAQLATNGCTPEHIQLAVDALQGIWVIDERTRSNMYATARDAVEAWSDPIVARSAETSEESEITPQWLLSGDNTLYVVAPDDEEEKFQPVFSGLLADLMRGAFADANRTKRGRLERPLIAALDEVANIAPVRQLPSWCSTCASRGISLLTVWQDRSQQRLRYGADAAETIWNNSGAKVILSGLADHATAAVGSLLGEEEHERRTLSYDGGLSSRGLSVQTNTRRLVTEDGLRRQRPSQALLVYRHLPPARLALRPYFEDRRLRALAGPDEDEPENGPTEGGKPKDGSPDEQAVEP